MASKALDGERKLHVVMFPWLAFGHIVPFFELSKFIAQKGHKVTFISTPRNIDRLPKLPPDLVSSIALVKIPLPKVEGLSENAEATMDVRPEEVDHLKKAYDGMEDDLARFLENSDADVIIYDFAPNWLPPIAIRLGILRFLFSIFNAWFLAFLGSTKALINGLEGRTRQEDFLAPPEWVTFETNVAYRLYEANWVLGAAATNASGFSDTYRLGKGIEGCNAMIIRHCNEFEPKWLKLLEELHQKEVIPLGLMPPHVQNSSDGTNEAWISIKNWLSSQSKESVVKPVGSAEEDTIELPEGFEERIKGRGIVWKNWAPQLKILGHEGVGAFLTHCGWSSIVEGLMLGRPLVMLPFQIDQGLNARVLADKQVGIEVPRNERDGSYTRNAVAESVRTVMADGVGQKLRDTAKATSAQFGDRELHDGYLDNFVEYLENLEPKP
ncbi:UNVERIFIED_CONTAM: putative UDP-rhamnose:rhamnosyltransferase 1 [Sesamum radiatum]|uniref:Glycosyltransferase n=1 Tax=Sesamum radiatum TaxID=300843 RepID=A0AAW2PG25_SESRA